MFDTVVDMIVKAVQSTIWPSLYGFMIALPTFAVLAVLWQYLFKMEKGQRSIRGAVRQALPLGAYRSMTFKSDFFAWWIGQLISPFLIHYFAHLITLVITSTIVYYFIVEYFGRPVAYFSDRSAIIAIQFVMLIISNEFGGYVSHYVFHRVPWLWSLHRTHHSAERLTVFTAQRAHPVELVIKNFIRTPISAMMLGITLYFTAEKIDPYVFTILAATSIGAVHNLINHSEVKISFGKLNYIFYGPVLHQIHHSAELRHRDKNFGEGYLAIFDWIFGTLYVPEKRETWRFGLNEEELGKNNPHIRIRDFYFEPFAHAWAIIRRHHQKAGSSKNEFKHSLPVNERE